ncbi:MAG: hypothetical protein EXR73_12785 [Myxococcales bacterium]|nr:hypothetical protein [Myxococcales bacterium]
MTSAHFIFIPGVLFVGFVLGFILGGRAARDQQVLDQKRAAEREATRATRAARAALKAQKDAPPNDAP